MPTLIRRRVDTEANWILLNPVIPARQLAFSSGVGEFGSVRFKIGDGVSVWSSLPYTTRKNNLAATTDPSVSDDSSLNYDIGSLWSNGVVPASPLVFICTDNTIGAAIWANFGGGGTGGTSTPIEESFVAVASQVIFALSDVPVATWVWINGAAQDASTWSTSGNNLTISTPSNLNDTVEVYYLTSATVTIGEANTASSSGSGESVVLPKVGIDLPFRSFKGGNGIGISSDADSITFDFSLIGVVFVETIADFPSPAAGVITLADNTMYKCFAASALSLGTNTIKFGVNSHIVADAPSFATFIYTGTDYIFDNNANDVDLDGIVVVGTSGKFMNFDGQSGTKLMICKNMTVLTDEIGIIKDAEVAFVNNFLFDGFTDGWDIQGTNETISMSIGRYRDYVNTAIDLGTSVNEDIRISLVTFAEGAVGSFALSGLTASGNVNNRALVDGCIFNGDGDALENIDSCDLRWEFKSNTGKPEIGDSLASASGYVADGDEATTVISGGSGDSGNPIVISGTWTIEMTCRFTGDGAGKLTYTGLGNETLFISSKLEVSPSSGTNIEYWFHIRKNGTTLDLVSRDLVTADANSPRKIILQTVMEFATGDYIEVVVENRSNTTNAEINAVNFIAG